MLNRRRFLWTTSAGGLLALGQGCALFREQGAVWTAFRKTADSEGGSALPGIPTSRDAMQLEVIFVERPADDPLLGDMLWREVDQIGALDVNVRANLNQNGIRIGHTSSSPPRALETLLGLRTQFSDGPENDAMKRLVGRRIVLASGAETEVQCSPLLPRCTVEVINGEKRTTATYEQARFVFRIQAQRVQDGWANLQFVPEIHHGQSRLRQVAGQMGWELRTGQQVEPLFGQRFSITVNTGEMSLITADGKNPESIGHRCFISQDGVSKIQRLLVVRLADMSRTDALYAPQ